MATTIRLPANSWKPRHYQTGFWDYMQRTPYGARAILCHHRRAGKDHTAVNWASVAAHKRVGLYIHVFPYNNQGRKVIWNGIDRNGVKFLDAFPNELVAGRQEAEMRLKLKNGSIYQVIGADDPDKLVGINCVGAIFSEYALMNPKALDLVMPILNENGGWAIFPSTPRGQNHFYHLLENAKKDPRWYYSIENVESTGAIPLSALDEERARGVDEALIQQEYYCSFTAPLQGAYYEKQMSMLMEQRQITKVPHDPALPVYTFWDLGVNDSMSIIYVQFPRSEQPQIINFDEFTGEGMPYSARRLQEQSNRWGYNYAEHWAPHDVMQREVGTAKTVLDTAREHGIRFRVVQRHEVEDGIEAARSVLPRCWFDEKNCGQLVEHLKSYRKQWDETNKVYRNRPVHDQHSHAADAFRYFSVYFDVRRRRQTITVNAQPTAQYDPFATV